MRVGILGYGEVGRAIASFFPNPKIKDLARDDGLKGISVLHVCIPVADVENGQEEFIRIVCDEVAACEPPLTVIHSTVLPGTTREIVRRLPNSLQNVVHSPVRGVHASLVQALRTFVKYVGALTPDAGRLAQRHLGEAGFQVKVCMPPEVTELGKLLSTAYYGLCIAFHGEAQAMCHRYGVNFREVMTDFNQSYNAGYAALGMDHVLRPNLQPPDSEGIGGHCIIPNAKMLARDCNGSLALGLVLKYLPQATERQKAIPVFAHSPSPHPV